MPHHPLRRPHVSNQWCSSRTSRGSRSFGAKDNDLLEAIVFIGLLERRSWVGGAYETNRRGGEENLFDELNSTLNVGKT